MTSPKIVGLSPHMLAYMPAEENKLFRKYPWKVYNLRLNPEMRGLVGRTSFSNAEAATAFAVEQESQTTKEA